MAGSVLVAHAERQDRIVEGLTGPGVDAAGPGQSAYLFGHHVEFGAQLPCERRGGADEHRGDVERHIVEELNKLALVVVGEANVHVAVVVEAIDVW